MITIYTKNYCPYCIKAKNLLDSLGAKYEEIDVTNTPEMIMELAKKSGIRTVPQIYVGDNCLGGFDNINTMHDKGELVKKLELEK